MRTFKVSIDLGTLKSCRTKTFKFYDNESKDKMSSQIQKWVTSMMNINIKEITPGNTDKALNHNNLS